MHEIAQICSSIALQTLLSFPWRIIIKGTHTLK